MRGGVVGRKALVWYGLESGIMVISQYGWHVELKKDFGADGDGGVE